MTLEPHAKPFVRRQKNDGEEDRSCGAAHKPTNDADATCEAAQRPNMRFVSVKCKEKQGAAAVFRVRELLIRQRTQTINALRGHLTEFGEVVPQGAWNARRLTELVEADDDALPSAARATLQVLVDGLRHLDERITARDPDRQTAEGHIRIALMNRFSTLGTAEIVRLG